HPVRAHVGDQGAGGRGLAEIGPPPAHARRGRRRISAGDRMDLRPGGEEAPGERAADEAGRAGHQGDPSRDVRARSHRAAPPDGSAGERSPTRSSAWAAFQTSGKRTPERSATSIREWVPSLRLSTQSIAIWLAAAWLCPPTAP